jgi:hypothetical protein
LKAKQLTKVTRTSDGGRLQSERADAHDPLAGKSPILCAAFIAASSKLGANESEIIAAVDRALDGARADGAGPFATPPGTYTAPRADTATEARIDAAADVAGVSRNDVLEHLRLNVAMHRGAAPTEDQIGDAVHSVKMRSYFTGGVR